MQFSQPTKTGLLRAGTVSLLLDWELTEAVLPTQSEGCLGEARTGAPPEPGLLSLPPWRP